VSRIDAEALADCSIVLVRLQRRECGGKRRLSIL